MSFIGKRNTPNISPAKLLAILFFAIVFFVHASAQAATLSLSPGVGSYHVGSAINVRVLVDSGGQSINAISGNVTFSNDTLTLESISKSGIVTLWAQNPSYANASGTASFQGVVLNGYTGSSGTIVTLLFKAKAAGTATVAFSGSGTSVLLNDGQGTNALSGSNGASFTIVPGAAQPEQAQPQPAPITETAPPVTETATPSVAPAITDYQHPLVPGNFIVVRGTGPANSTVTVTLTNTAGAGTGTTQQVSVPTDASGAFTFVSSQTATEGSIYSVIVTAADGQHTSPLLIPVQNSLWFTIVAFAMTLMAVQAPVWLALLLLIIIVIYFAYRNHILKKHLQMVIDKMHEIEPK